jgi:hypothetical protein
MKVSLFQRWPVISECKQPLEMLIGANKGVLNSQDVFIWQVSLYICTYRSREEMKEASKEIIHIHVHVQKKFFVKWIEKKTKQGWVNICALCYISYSTIISKHIYKEIYTLHILHKHLQWKYFLILTPKTTDIYVPCGLQEKIFAARPKAMAHVLDQWL